jgi:photosystem II stability/assembly factor-like uncharacterized protein
MARQNRNVEIIDRSKDDPFLRHIASTLDLGEPELTISKLKLRALEHARHMPTSDDGTLPSPTEDYIYSQQAIPGKTNWLQVGPTCIRDSQSLSTYYWPVNIPTSSSGRITSIVIHPGDRNVIYVGTASGGVWKTEDRGRNWIATSDHAPSLGIGALVMDPNNPDILYAGTGEGNIAWYETIGGAGPRGYYGCGLLKTVDGGKKWKLLGGNDNPFNGASFYCIAISPFNSSIIFAATTYGLFRSTTRGEDWVKMNNGLPSDDDNLTKVTDVVIDPNDPNVVFVAVGGNGIYKSSNPTKTNPSWKKLTKGLPQIKPKFHGVSLTRLSLAISHSEPGTIYALGSSEYSLLDKKVENITHHGIFEHPPGSGRYWGKYTIDQCYYSTDGGDSWEQIPLPGLGSKISPWIKNSIGGQGTYNLNIAADPKHPGVIYLSGTSLWKGTKDNNTGKWDIRDIGLPIHPDHHAFAFDPIDPAVIYAGSDGGIYKSINGGDTWSNVINEGLCITQFEFIDQHPKSEAIIFGGTQDNGTLQYRNSPAFYFSDYGDGGFVSIDSHNPNTIVHQYTSHILYISKSAGKKDAWVNIPVVDSKCNPPPCLFYAPFALDQENPKNIAFGSDRIFLDTNQGLDRWKIASGKQKGKENSIDLPDLFKDPVGKEPAELVSALNFINSKLIYAATIFGKVYRIINDSGGWKPSRIDADSLPSMYVWDVATMPDNPDSIVVVMGGYGSQKEAASNIWYGNMNKGNQFEWKDISGEGEGKLPQIPISAVVIDDQNPDQIFIGTDIGVFKTSNKGKMWIRFSENLPTCSVNDMQLHSESRLLRIATYGRGIWERKLDTESFSDVNLFVRKHLMDTGYFPLPPPPSPSPLSSEPPMFASFADSLQDEDGGVKLNDILTWDMCPDIKIDSARGDPPVYQIDTSDDVDYVKFENGLQHRNPKQGDMCNIYVQVHDRGIKPTVGGITIRLFYAKMSAVDGTYPKLPKDFWNTTFSPNDKSGWKPILSTKSLPEGQKTLTNTEPTIVTWQWYVPPEIGNKAGILVIVDSAEDPISEDNKKITNIEELVRKDRHIGLKTLDISN